MTIKVLPERFDQKQCHFEQIDRQGKFAIYHRFQKVPELGHYEVVVIQSHNGREIAGKYIEPAEFYPSDSQWGQYGWTYSAGGSGSKEQALLDAQKRFSGLLEAENNKNQIKP